MDDTMDIKITGHVTKSGWVTGDPTGSLFTAHSPNGKVFGYYKTMQKALIGRIWAAALFNVPKVNKRSGNGWADLARAVDMPQPKLTRDGKKRSHSRMSAGVSNIVYQMSMRGTLPKDADKLAKLIQLAGEPFTSPEMMALIAKGFK